MTTNQETSKPPDESFPTNGRDVTLAGLAGVLSALTIVAIFAAMIVLPSPDSATVAGQLGHMNEHASTLRLANGLYPVLHVLLLAFFVGLYGVVRRAGDVSRFALAACLLGLVFFLLTAIIFDGRIQLASAYDAAGDPTKDVIVSTISVVERVQLGVSIAGHVFTWGLGVAGFSVAVLRTSVLSRWVGWLGLVFAATAWLNVPRLVWDAFGPMLLVMDAIGVVWLFAVGVMLLRIDGERIARVGSDRSGLAESEAQNTNSTGVDTTD